LFSFLLLQLTKDICIYRFYLEGYGGENGFGIGEEQLTLMTREHNFSAMEEYGGVSAYSPFL
jgi:hypothetical protein